MVLAVPVESHAQEPSDRIRTAALRDFHGPDMEGKDGPLAKAGLDLLVLYHEYRAFQQGDDDSFSSSLTGIRVDDGRVIIDAVAATKAEVLRSDLESLGLNETSTAGRIVSGTFPMDRIPDLARLESLRAAMPSRMETNNRGTTTASPKEAARPDSIPDSSSSSSPGSPPVEPPSRGSSNTVLLFLVGAFVLLILIDL